MRRSGHACRPPLTPTVRQDARDWTCPHGYVWRFVDGTIGWQPTDPDPAYRPARPRRTVRIATGIGYVLAFPVWALTRRSSARWAALVILTVALVRARYGDTAEATLAAALAAVCLLIDVGSRVRELHALTAERLAPPADPRLLPEFARDFTANARVEIRLPLRDAQPFLRDPVVLVPTEGQRPTAVRCDILTWEVEQ